MTDQNDELKQTAADIRRHSVAILNSMVLQRDTLRDMEQRMPSRRFKRWAREEMGLDEVTLRDMLMFDGTVDGITEPMIRWLMTVIVGGKTSYSDL